jgi:hypothetical protein
LLNDDGLRIAMGENANQLLKETFSVQAAAKKILESVRR